MSGTSLDAIAKANKTTVQTVEGVTVENAMLPNLGMESKVVGTAFGTAANKLSAPVEGFSGVFVVKTKTVTKAPKLPKYDDYIAKLKANAAQFSGRILPALKEKADIKDNRADFY